MLPPYYKTMNNNTIKESQEASEKDGNPPSSTGDFSDSKSSYESGKPARQKENKSKDNKNKKPNKKYSKKVKIPWVVVVCIMTLVLSFVFGIASQLVVNNIDAQNVIIAYLLILLIIFISIISDIIGVAATSCDPEPFLAMSARKVRGAKLAVKFAKNANIVSSVCCDVIGDICGIISGACGAAIVAVMAIRDNKLHLIISVLCSTIIAAVMITGKALGKKIAIKNSNKIIFNLAKTLSVFSKK